MPITSTVNLNQIQGTIYKITNLVNGKVYVGQTIRDPKHRWSQHKRGVNLKNPSLLQKAIKKHGVTNFTFEVICQASTQEELNKMEDHYIAQLNALAPAGYACLGSQSGPGIISNVTKEKMSKARLGKEPWNKGKTYKMAEESKENYRRGNSEKCLGRKMSDETKKKQSDFRKGKVFMTREQYETIGEKAKGRKMPEEAIQKIRAFNTGRKHSAETVKNISVSKTKIYIKRIDLKTNEERVYTSPLELKLDGFSYTAAYKVAAGAKYRHSYGGYRWEFISKEETA
jgi:group I intron endonuclease